MRTGAAANVDMKLVKKHSQLMWKDLRRTGEHQRGLSLRVSLDTAMNRSQYRARAR